MTIRMNDDHVVSVAQLRELLKLSQCAVFRAEDRKATYAWIQSSLNKFRYFGQRKRDKKVVKRYLVSLTGYSETQIDRLIARKRHTGRVFLKKRAQPVFPRIYTAEDVALLAKVDAAEERRNGHAVRKTLRDMYALYGDQRFVRLRHISVSHLYNLRGTRVYRSRNASYEHTRSVVRAIGIRTKPRPEGRPGYLRVDSVHQGDLDKEKGVYHINLVDEVTQWEVVVCVEGISERFLLPALEEALAQFPFAILGFHSDNGSEYINEMVAELLNKLVIEQTKSRSRRTNDNALVESKNGAVIRRHMGHGHIPRRYAALINSFYRAHFNAYLAYHRQCAFPDEEMDARGKIVKRYRTYLTPCEKLLLVEKVELYLKEGVTREGLAAEAAKLTHLAAAEEMQRAKVELFTKIRSRMVQ